MRGISGGGICRGGTTEAVKLYRRSPELSVFQLKFLVSLARRLVLVELSPRPATFPLAAVAGTGDSLDVVGVLTRPYDRRVTGVARNPSSGCRRELTGGL